MNDPKEAVRVDDNESTQQALVMTFEETEQLLHSNVSYPSIIFAAEATKDIAKIIQIISKNRQTLRRLTLDRLHSSTQISTIPWEQTKQLGLAIGSCQDLRSLQIKKFRGSFNEGVKYLITGIVRLTNLGSLNLKETYLAPYLSLLLEGLSNLRSLHFLNLDCSGLVKEWDFSTFLYQFIKHNTSLRELDLGSSPIWTNAFHPILSSFEETNNYQLRLKWSPPTEYQENEILYQRLRLAVNWDEDQAVKRDCLSQIEAARSGNPCEVSVNHFMLARQKLDELLKILEQRRTPNKITKLQFTITRPSTDLELMLIKISGCLVSLETLEITIECEAASSYLLWPLFDSKLAYLLRKITQLHTLKLVNFQGVLPNYHGVLNALFFLPNLKILVLKDTYLGEAGASSLEALLEKKKLTELDVTNSALVSDACFHSLLTGLRQCSSLQRLVLGQSPMMGVWLRMLVTSGRRSQPPEIVWQSSDFKDMSDLFERMCKALQATDRSLNTSTFVSKFITQDLDLLKTQTAALIALQQENNTVSTNSSGRGFFGGTVERNLEMQSIRAVAKGYGTANGK